MHGAAYCVAFISEEQINGSNGTSGESLRMKHELTHFLPKTKASIFKSAEVRVLGRKFCHGVTNLSLDLSGDFYSHIDSVDHGKITDKLKRE